MGSAVHAVDKIMYPCSSCCTQLYVSCRYHCRKLDEPFFPVDDSKTQPTNNCDVNMKLSFVDLTPPTRLSLLTFVMFFFLVNLVAPFQHQSAEGMLVLRVYKLFSLDVDLLRYTRTLYLLDVSVLYTERSPVRLLYSTIYYYRLQVEIYVSRVVCLLMCLSTMDSLLYVSVY